MLVLLALFACTTEAPPPEGADPPPVVSGLPAGPNEPSVDAPPSGRIGGAPILDRPVVLGGIASEVVEATLVGRRAETEACFQAGLVETPRLRGKVLVRFQVLADGQVGTARVRATSLRNSAVEACVLEVVRATRFPPLVEGEEALVDYPFGFAPT